MPGNPTEIRSYFSIGLMSSCSVETNRDGDSGYGGGTRTRPVNIWPPASSADAFKPLPPMSIARVIWPFLFAVIIPRRLGVRPAERSACDDLGPSEGRQTSNGWLRGDLEAGEHAVDDGGDQFVGHSLAADELRIDQRAGDEGDEQVDVDTGREITTCHGALDD